MLRFVMPTILVRVDEPILIDGITWKEFKSAEQILDRPGIRLFFLDGALEIRKMPGRVHETLKRRISALLEIYLEYIGIDFTPMRSWTLESETGLVRREADESYELGPDHQRPDLVIEVVVTSGGVDKLLSYLRLGIPEVWFWESSRLSLYALRGHEYEQISQSEVLPGLDIDLLARIHLSSHVRALQEFRQALQQSD
jgi:Uma2 family endonuclease